MKGVIKGVKAAIFDLDGTLFDSVHLWEDIDERFLRARGKEPTAEYKAGLAALGNREIADYTIKFYSLTDTPQALLNEWASMAKHDYANVIKLFDGAKQYLTDVAARGIKILAVTSLARELAEPCLINNGVSPLFFDVITADESGHNKSSSKIYTYAAERAGVKPSDTVVFDDVAVAIRSAKLAGAITVAVRGERGYCDGTELFEGTADYIVDAVADGPKLIP